MVGDTVGPGLGDAGLKHSDSHVLNIRCVHTLLLLRAPQETLVPLVSLAHRGPASICLLSLVCLILRRVRNPCNT